MDRKLQTHLADLERAATRLEEISGHDALILLRNCLSAPKIMHTLRSSPCYEHDQLGVLDQKLKDCLSRLLNVELSTTQWIQASLPVRHGGLGVRSISQLAPSAFLASWNFTSELRQQILRQCTNLNDSDMAAERALTLWNRGHERAAPTGLSARIQKGWDLPIIEETFNTILEAVRDPSDKARLLAVSAPGSSDWLHALPISSCGLRLDDEAIRVAVGLRLGTKLCEPHQCICGNTVDPRGHHCLSCRRSSGRTSRHHNINDIVCRAFQRAEVPVVKEPSGLARSDGKRPDGLTQIPWTAGRCLIWDVTVTDTLANSYTNISSVSAGGVAERAAGHKSDKYAELANTYTFVPIAIETLGPMNATGMELIRCLGRRISAVTGEKRETVFLRQRLSISLQRFNAVCFRGTFSSELVVLDDIC